MRTNQTRTRLIFSLAIVSSLCLARAQGPTLSGSAPPKAKAGSSLILKVSIAIPDGYHIYGPKDKTGVVTSISVSTPSGYRATVTYPPTTTYQGLGDVSQVYSGKVVVPVKVSVPKNAKGKATFRISVTSQACNDKSCLVPETRSVTLTTQIK